MSTESIAPVWVRVLIIAAIGLLLFGANWPAQPARVVIDAPATLSGHQPPR